MSISQTLSKRNNSVLIRRSTHLGESVENAEEGDEEEEEIQEEVKRIPRIDALCFAVILEECLERLRVLKHIMEKDGLEAELSKPVFAVGNAHHRAHLGENIPEPSSLPLFIRTLEERETFLESNAKLQDNRNHIDNLFVSIRDEVLQDGTYTVLTEAIPVEHKQNRLLTETREIENELKTVAETLAKRVKDVREEMKYHLEETEKKVLVEKEKLQNSVNRALIEFQYMTKKMQSPMAQRSAVLKRSKEKELEKANSQIEREQKIHSELMLYLEYAIDNLHDEMQNWMENWEHDAGEKNREIMEMNTKKDAIEDNIQSLLELEQEHKRVIEDTTNLREKAKYEQQRKLLETKAATKIQIWWKQYYYKMKRKRKKKRKSPKSKVKGRGRKK